MILAISLLAPHKVLAKVNDSVTHPKDYSIAYAGTEKNPNQMVLVADDITTHILYLKKADGIAIDDLSNVIKYDTGSSPSLAVAPSDDRKNFSIGEVHISKQNKLVFDLLDNEGKLRQSTEYLPADRKFASPSITYINLPTSQPKQKFAEIHSDMTGNMYFDKLFGGQCKTLAYSKQICDSLGNPIRGEDPKILWLDNGKNQFFITYEKSTGHDGKLYDMVIDSYGNVVLNPQQYDTGISDSISSYSSPSGHLQIVEVHASDYDVAHHESIYFDLLNPENLKRLQRKKVSRSGWTGPDYRLPSIANISSGTKEMYNVVVYMNTHKSDCTGTLNAEMV